MSLDALPDRDIATTRMVLATDLDGTFLGGSEEDRQRLYRWIESNRDSVGLIFVTGRDPRFIRELCAGGVPWPEYVVGDVGTTIARLQGGEVTPLAPLEEEIAATWGDAGETVRAALDGHPGLTLQPTPFRYRISYDLDAETFDPSASDKVRDLGHDPLISDNRFFDVLPRGISKGPSLRRLVAHLGLEETRVLAAGDTLNDLSMLQCGLPAVAVGGAEPALLAEVSGLPHVHTARAIGAAGILEAIGAFGLHDIEGV
ncbi:MAG TPA: alpha,alpha-trehalose-phosphate synthase [Citreicella sp.]|nr:alpha,alpha-trehalose-phosphate synthase [Citreicella sp.]